MDARVGASQAYISDECRNVVGVLEQTRPQIAVLVGEAHIVVRLSLASKSDIDGGGADVLFPSIIKELGWIPAEIQANQGRNVWAVYRSTLTSWYDPPVPMIAQPRAEPPA